MIRRVWLVIAVTALGLAGCGGSDTFGVGEAVNGDADHAFFIPEGAGEAIDAGEPLAILPAELDVAVGEILEIVNDDVRGHLVGPFYVGAGETLRRQFTSPGVFTGGCTVHPSGEIVVTVS